VPFTLAHGAAALPFRRFHLVFSGLLVGTFAPDFEYFLRLSPDDGFGHTLLGTFVLTLPLALLVLWLFHAFVKLPVTRLLPDAIQRRLANHLDEFGFGGVARFALIVGSILLGMATHLAWDSFTHRNTWPYRHWSILSQTFHVPMVGAIPFYKVFQHGSTIIGIAVLSTWLVFRYRATEPSCHPPSNNFALSPQASVLFFFDPCRGRALAEVTAGIGRSLVSCPRPVYVAYVAPRSELEQLFASAGFLKEIYRNTEMNFWIYQSCKEQPS
jgi:Domain of unknown function (DUF4184)